MEPVRDHEYRKADKRIIEQLAELEHKQWISWASNISNTEKISPERFERWQKLWCSYENLTEEQKNQDREYAKKILPILHSEFDRLKEEEYKEAITEAIELGDQMKRELACDDGVECKKPHIHGKDLVYNYALSDYQRSLKSLIE